jgi:hypothetical protein
MNIENRQVEFELSVGESEANPNQGSRTQGPRQPADSWPSARQLAFASFLTLILLADRWASVRS